MGLTITPQDCSGVRDTDMASKIGRPVKLALFRDPTVNSEMEFIGDESMEKYLGIRITEYVEVTFQPLQQEAFIHAALATLDDQEKKLRTEFQRKLDAISQTRANFLAITHIPTAAPQGATHKGEQS